MKSNPFPLAKAHEWVGTDDPYCRVCRARMRSLSRSYFCGVVRTVRTPRFDQRDVEHYRAWFGAHWFGLITRVRYVFEWPASKPRFFWNGAEWIARCAVV
jgi:hypothetical protein